MIIEEISIATTTSNLPVVDYMPNGKAFGCVYFDCDFNTNIQSGRKKRKRWKNFIDDDIVSTKIKAYKQKNPKHSIMLRDKKTDSYVMANASWWS